MNNHRNERYRADDEYNLPERGYRDQNDRRHERSSHNRSGRDSPRRASRERNDRNRDRSPYQRRESDSWKNQGERRSGSHHNSSHRRQRSNSPEGQDQRRAGSYHNSFHRRQSSNSPERRSGGPTSINPPAPLNPIAVPPSEMIEMEKYRSQLIALVQCCPNLWNPSNPSFRDRNRRKKTWIDIGQNLGIPAQHCRNYWKSLRAKFAREITRLPDRIPDDFKQVMDTELYFLKPFYENDMKTDVNAAALPGPQALMAFLLQSALAQSQSLSGNFPVPSTSTPIGKSQDRSSAIKSERPSTPAPSPAPAPAFAAASCSTVKPETLFDGKGEPFYIDIDSSGDEDYFDSDEQVKEQNNVGSRLPKEKQFEKNNSNLNQMLADGVTANIKHFSPEVKRIILFEILRVNPEFSNKGVFQSLLPELI